MVTTAIEAEFESRAFHQEMHSSHDMNGHIMFRIDYSLNGKPAFVHMVDWDNVETYVRFLRDYYGAHSWINSVVWDANAR